MLDNIKSERKFLILITKLFFSRTKDQDISKMCHFEIGHYLRNFSGYCKLKKLY